jgi:hypothetical protein
MKTFVNPIPKEYQVTRLKLDPENPRLRLHPGGTSEKEVIERLCRLGGKGSPALVVKHIKTDGGFLHNEAPVLYIDPATNSKVVIDGNRRIAALKMILNPSLVPSTLRGLRNDCEKLEGLVPSRIRCWFTSNLADAKRIVYRAHNEGTKEWETLAKYSTYYDDHFRGQGIEEISEMSGAPRSQIVRQINTWVLIDYLARNIKEFQIDGSGITSFERVTTSYSEFHRKIGASLSEEGIYILPQSEELATLILKIFNKSAKERGLSRLVENNDEARAAWIDHIIPSSFSPTPDRPKIESPKEPAAAEPLESLRGENPPSSNIQKSQSPPAASDAEGTTRQILSPRKNVGKKAFEIFKEYLKLDPIHDFPIASAALARAMIETTLKHHAKRLGCYSESAEQQQKRHSEALDEVANALKKNIKLRGLPFSSDLVSAIGASTKSISELNDVMHKDGTFAARPAVKSSLQSLAAAVSQLVSIQ